jgi:hypothetical protein
MVYDVQVRSPAVILMCVLHIKVFAYSVLILRFLYLVPWVSVTRLRSQPSKAINCSCSVLFFYFLMPSLMMAY